MCSLGEICFISYFIFLKKIRHFTLHIYFQSPGGNKKQQKSKNHLMTKTSISSKTNAVTLKL